MKSAHKKQRQSEGEEGKGGEREEIDQKKKLAERWGKRQGVCEREVSSQISQEEGREEWGGGGQKERQTHTGKLRHRRRHAYTFVHARAHKRTQRNRNMLRHRHKITHTQEGAIASSFDILFLQNKETSPARTQTRSKQLFHARHGHINTRG